MNGNDLAIALSAAAFLLSLAAILRKPSWHYDGECCERVPDPSQVKQTPCSGCNNPKKCAGPQSFHYGLKEGTIKKGGQNKAATQPRPAPPKGQGVKKTLDAECPTDPDCLRCESCYKLKQSPSPDCNDPKQHIPQG